VAQANAPAFTRQGTNQTAQVLGYFRAGDPGDVFWLGNLSEATQIRMAYRLPGTSMLVGIAEVLDNSGAVVASAAAGETNLNYTVPMAQGGAYYVRMRAQAGTTGLFSQYLLSIELSDLLPPAIVADSLPAEGTTSLALFDRFTLTFSEDLLASSVNAADTFDLRAAGADGLFDTVDDLLVGVTVSPAYSSGLTANFTISGGALQPGLYRFIARTTLQDRAGNSLASAWTRQFVIGQVAGFNTELEPNNTRETATALAMMSTQPNLISGAGRGYLANGSDVDFYRFEALAGDVMVLAAENPGNPGSSGLSFILYDPAGAQLFSLTAAANGLLQTPPLLLTNSGTYAVRVAPYYSYYSEHRLRVSLYRNNLPTEIEANNTLATANPLSFTTNGTSRSAVAAGYLQLGTDLDYFNLGIVEAGKTIFLGSRQPASSPLVPVVSVYDANGVYLPEAGSGRPSDGVAEVRIQQTGVCYALIRPGAGSAGLMSEYLLDVLILPTEDVVFPNLQVTSLDLPVTTGLRSGEPFTFAFTVANVGSLATPGGLWFDRVVLSTDPLVDENDLVLGLYQHNGVLAPGQSYSVTNTVNLPDGISGDFYLVAKADHTDTVNEFLLEGDNETATENPLAISLADYADLRVENLLLAGPDGNQTYTLTWDTFNRGTAPAPPGFKDRVRVRNQTTATTVFDQAYPAPASLAPNASLPRQAIFTASTAGTYLVEVTTDSDQQVFEYDSNGHGSAELNTVTTNFAITQWFVLALNSAPPGAGTLTGAGTYPAGTLVTVTATPITNQAPYSFQNWVEGGVVRSANSSYSFILNKDTALTAVFGLPAFQLAASNYPAGAGTVLGTGVYSWGSTNLITAQPAFGYKFSHWTENGLTLSSNPVLTVVLYSNRLFGAHYAEAHLQHVVTAATLPPGLATVTGTGTFTNGQSTTLTAPAAVTNTPPDYYAFKRFTLSGATVSTNASFVKTFATTDPTNLHYVAEYEFVDRTPPVLASITATANVASAVITWSTTEPTTGRIAYGTNSSYGLTNSTSLLRTNHSFLLSGLLPATLYHYRVYATDAAGNEAFSGDLTFTTLAPPDLIAGAVATPAAAQAGTLIPLTFVISNTGPGAAIGPWQNAVLLASSPEGAGAISLGAVSFNPGAGGIAPGASLNVTQQVIVPSVGTGPRYFGVQVDSGNQIFELVETNNTAFSTAPLNIIATDLRVARISAPASAAFGDTLQLEFVVTNSGTAPAAVSWTDRVYLSTASNTLQTLLAGVPAPVVPLGPGGSYTNLVPVTLPLAAGQTPGGFYLVVAADQGNAVAESDEGNNLASVALTVSLPPL
ncbi:MAG TPA: CARDB domain-containing protein, partial [Candidatus Paceibacterota bacterium]|nr:CARDB domain-containing protein [Candidatus Paceibacterota bacterium]